MYESDDCGGVWLSVFHHQFVRFCRKWNILLSLIFHLFHYDKHYIMDAPPAKGKESSALPLERALLLPAVFHMMIRLIVLFVLQLVLVSLVQLIIIRLSR